MIIDESEVLGYFLRQGTNVEVAALGEVEDEDLDAIRFAFCEVLFQNASPADKEPADKEPAGKEGSVLEWEEIEFERQGELKSIIHRSSHIGRTHKIVAFNLRDGFLESGLPLLGLCVLLFSGKWGPAAIPGIAAICKTLWDRLVILKRPQDAEAIDTLEALLNLRAESFGQKHVGMPTTAKIAERREKPVSGILKPIAQLSSLKVIKCAEWGDQRGDLEHPGNRWKVPL